MAAPQFPTKRVNEVRNGLVSLAKLMDTSETIAASSNITISIVQGTSALVVSSVAVSTGALTINGSTVPAGQAVTFVVSGGLADTRYKMQVQAVTDAGQTLQELCSLRVEAST